MVQTALSPLAWCLLLLGAISVAGTGLTVLHPHMLRNLRKAKSKGSGGAPRAGGATLKPRVYLPRELYCLFLTSLS